MNRGVLMLNQMKRRKTVFLGMGGFVLILCLFVGVFVFLLFHRAEGHFFDSNGCKVHYTVDGAGPAVILVHGLGVNGDLNWRRTGITRLLDDEFQVIALDLRGHGLTDKPTDPDQYGKEMVEDIMRLMDHLEIERAAVAGYSLGGFIVLKLVTAYPKRITCAALCAAGWKDPEDPSEIPNPYRPPAAQSKMQIPRMVGASQGNQKSLFHLVRNGVGDRLVPKAAKKALKSAYADLTVTREELENNTVPTICFMGDKDGLRPLGEDLQRHMARLEYVTLENKDHFTTCLSSEFRRGLLDFLRRHGKE